MKEAGEGAEPPQGKRVKDLDSLPWVEKYRPSSLSELISHEDIISTISRLIQANRLPHLLFYGPPGTGKTSTILACARELYGDNFASMTLELNASDSRGIDVVRDQVQVFASTRKLFSSGIKLIILDEADALTNDAQFALRRVIEKYTKNTRFCMICNYVSKIIPALQSRCTRFRFAPLEEAQMGTRLTHVIEQEGLNVEADGRSAILRLACGDMRKVLNILQSTSMAFPVVNEENVCLSTGTATPVAVQGMLDALLNDDFKTAYGKIRQVQIDQGIALEDLITELSQYVMLLDLPAKTHCLLLDRLSTAEYDLSFGASDQLQLGNLVGMFVEAKEQLSQLPVDGEEKDAATAMDE